MLQNDSGPDTKAKMAERFSSVFAEPQLTKMQEWLEQVSLQGEAISDLMTSIRNVGPDRPIRIIERDERTARLRTETTVVETYGLGYNLQSVDLLFEQYPIVNASLEAVRQTLKTNSDPDRITFEITSTNVFEISAVRVGSEWKVSDVSVVPQTSTLRISPP